MKSDIVYILCKLERIFPPTFFSIMVHLMIHLPEQVLLTGPVHFTWMFPIERYDYNPKSCHTSLLFTYFLYIFICTNYFIFRQLGGYKGFVKNRAKPEGSIANAYIAHECVTYCKSYLHNTDATEGLDPARTPTFNLSIVSEDIRIFGNLPNSEILREDELCEAHWWVLQHCDEVKEYRDAHLGLIQLKYQNRHEERHKKTYPGYFLKWVRLISPFQYLGKIMPFSIITFNLYIFICL